MTKFNDSKAREVLRNTPSWSERIKANDPSANQTAEEIAAYYKSAEIGMAACLRQTQGRSLRFDFTEIVGRGARSMSVKHLPILAVGLLSITMDGITDIRAGNLAL